MDEELKLLQWMVTAGVISLVVGATVWARKRDLKADQGARVTLRMPVYVLIVGLVDFLVFLGFAVGSNLYPNETVTTTTTAVFLGFALLGLLLIFVWLVQRHRIDDQELGFTNVLGRRFTVPWAEVTKVDYSPSLQWFIVHWRGKRLHVSEIVTGLRSFSRTVLDRVEPSAITPRARTALERFGAGELAR